MMKLKTAFMYRMRTLLISASLYLFFFLLFAGIIPTIGILLIDNQTVQVNSDLMISTMIYLAIISYIGINTDFKLFIQNGMNRRNIFFVNILSAVVLSFLMSVVLMAIGRLFALDFIKGFRLSHQVINFYTGENILKIIALLFAFLFLASALGIVFGIFNDMFSNIIKIIVYGLLMVIPLSIVLLAQIYRETLLVSMIDFFKWIAGMQTATPNMTHIFITLLVSTAILLTIAYCLNRRRELKRMNG